MLKNVVVYAVSHFVNVEEKVATFSSKELAEKYISDSETDEYKEEKEKQAKKPSDNDPYHRVRRFRRDSLLWPYFDNIEIDIRVLNHFSKLSQTDVRLFEEYMCVQHNPTIKNPTPYILYGYHNDDYYDVEQPPTKDAVATFSSEELAKKYVADSELASYKKKRAEHAIISRRDTRFKDKSLLSYYMDVEIEKNEDYTLPHNPVFGAKKK